MQFSEHYRIARGPDDDWFDPLLTRDTRLSVDPFRVYADPGFVGRPSRRPGLDCVVCRNG
jgi:hypothetical protein